MIIFGFLVCICCLGIDFETVVGNHTIQEWNVGNEYLFPVIERLEDTTFFKIFKVDLESECSLWVVNKVCGMEGGCDVCVCNDEEVPINWKTSDQDKVDTFMNPFHQGVIWQEDGCDAWYPKPCETDLTYVNLRLNPHSNTGFKGPKASRIWSEIYGENCFLGKGELCYEEEIFFRTISGMHQCITVSIASYFYKREKKEFYSYEDFNPNVEFFQFGVLPHDDRVENLYFFYSFVLRSMQRLRPFLLEYSFETNDESEDKIVRELVKKILNYEELKPHFNEDLKENKERLKDQEEKLRGHFYNISMIMDCIECEKCKMWAKLDMLGLSVAFKVFLSDDSELEDLFQSLHRNEIIAYFNTFGQVSRALYNYNRLKKFIWRKKVAPYLAWAVMALVFLFVVWVIIRLVSKVLGGGEKKKKNKKE